MPRNYRKDALIIFMLLAIVFAYFFQDSGWNGNSRYGLIFAAVERNTFSINHYYNTPGTQTGDHSFFNGNYYSDKTIGPALIGAIFYKPIFWFHARTGHFDQDKMKEMLVFLVIGLPSAIAGALMYILCLYLSHKRLRSLLITLVVTLGTMYFPYSTTFFSHQFTSSLLFTSFFIMFFIKKGQIKPKWITLCLVGLLMGLAFISELTCAAILLPLAIYYLTIVLKMPSQLRWRSILFPLLGTMIPVTLQLLYDQICFGNPFSIGYQNLDTQTFSSAMSQGLMGIGWPNLKVLFFMTFHPMLGLFWQSPVLILAFIGAVYGFRQHNYRVEIILSTWLIISYLVLISGYYMWWGGEALSSRHIIPILPFFCLLLVFLPDPFNWGLIGLGAISLFQMLVAAASTVLVEAFHISELGKMKFLEYSYIYDFCLKKVFDPQYGTNLGIRFLHLESWTSLIPLLIVFITLLVVFFWKDIFQPAKIER